MVPSLVPNLSSSGFCLALDFIDKAVHSRTHKSEIKDTPADFLFNADIYLTKMLR